jgi:hypothetical protein
MADKAERILLLELDAATARAERAEAAEADLRQHILDIDAHATPYGDIPGEPGWVGTYLLMAGALHRALGKIGHSAPKCQAEEDLRLTQQAFEEYRASWGKATEATLAEVERLRATVQRVRALVAEWSRKCLDPADAFALSRNELLAALDGTGDAQRPAEGGTEPDQAQRPAWLDRLEAESRQHAAELGETDEEYADG